MHDYNVTKLCGELELESPAENLDLFMKEVLSRGSVDGVFGVKLMWDALGHFLDEANFLQAEEENVRVHQFFERYFPQAQLVFFDRENKVNQAISYDKAIQSGKWHSHDENTVKGNDELIFDPTIIHWIVDTFDKRKNDWIEFFNTSGMESYPLNYEQLTRDIVGELQKLVEWLYGYSQKVVPNLDHVREPVSDEINQCWQQWYTTLEKEKNWRKINGEAPNLKRLWIDPQSMEVNPDSGVARSLKFNVRNLSDEELVIADEHVEDCVIAVQVNPKRRVLRRYHLDRVSIPRKLDPLQEIECESHFGEEVRGQNCRMYLIPMIKGRTWIRLTGSNTPEIKIP